MPDIKGDRTEQKRNESRTTKDLELKLAGIKTGIKNMQQNVIIFVRSSNRTKSSMGDQLISCLEGAYDPYQGPRHGIQSTYPLDTLASTNTPVGLHNWQSNWIAHDGRRPT